jgi:UDP-N-acetylglucosamine 2-epimerase (non-hydrolysing)
MTSRRRVMVVVGTRPEAVKLLPVVEATRERPSLDVVLVATAQHRDMLDQVFDVWDLRPDLDLDLMRPGQDPTDVTVGVVGAMRQCLEAIKPHIVVLQGDTTTTFAAALASFYARTAVAHVEAGLRTWQKYAPFPEEINRRLTTTLADVHFAPTEGARRNLLAEGVPPDAIHVTGNTVIDALLRTRDRIAADRGLSAELDARFPFLSHKHRLVLVTAHRRESFGAGFEEICLGIRDIVEEWQDVEVVYPVHLNPAVRAPVERLLVEGGASSRIHLLEPLPYLDFVYLLNRSHLVLTDSGGVQEEAPAFGKPVLVMRDVTERPEAIEAGSALLVGASRSRIREESHRLLQDESAYARMAKTAFPFGRGGASARIADVLASWPGA